MDCKNCSKPIDKSVKRFTRHYCSIKCQNTHSEFQATVRKTNLEKYGEEYPSHDIKGHKTNLERYGTVYPMQNEEIFVKSMKARFKIKEYITETGKVFKYQGYENVAIDFLINHFDVNENQIINRDLPKILYLNPILQKTSRYYPDIWVPKLNLLIEVKSEYTIKHEPEVIYAKQQACRDAGFIHIIFVCTKKKIIEIK